MAQAARTRSTGRSPEFTFRLIALSAKSWEWRSGGDDFIARCRPEVPPPPPPAPAPAPVSVADWTFNGTDATIDDFNGDEFYDATNQQLVPQTFATTGNPISVNGSNSLTWP